MDQFRIRPAVSRPSKKPVPKGVVKINRKKPKIEKYDDSMPVFAYNMTPIENDQQLEMPPMEE